MIFTPKNSIEAEQSILASILLDSTIIKLISSKLKSYMFYNETNKKIYEVMYDMSNENKTIDIVTLSDELKKRNLLDIIGGISYITELVENLPNSANYESYVDIIVEYYKVRELHKTLDKGLYNIGHNNMSYSDTISILRQDIDTMEKDNVGNTKLKNIKEILKDRFAEFIDFVNTDNYVDNNVYTGFKSLDNVLGPLTPGQLIVIGGRPGQGKTAISLQIINNNCLKGKRVMFFSLEMNEKQLADRFISINTGTNSFILNNFKNIPENVDIKDFKDKRKGYINGMLDKLKNIHNNLIVDCSTKITVSEIRKKIILEQLKGNIDLVVIDYLGLITPEIRNSNKSVEIAEITRELKNMSGEINCPIILLSQLSREVEKRTNKRPLMSDLRDSGSIEQDANKILMLYRERYYEEFSDNKYLEVLVKKNREGSSGGSINLDYDLKTQIISEPKTN